MRKDTDFGGIQGGGGFTLDTGFGRKIIGDE
jgi:hypothetical protein